MYEIPPSVDHYLRISSKSMIHFPSLSLESSLSSSINGEELTSVSPKKVSLGHYESSSVANGEYTDELPSRKRCCDDEDDFQKSKKSLKGNDEEDPLTDTGDIESLPTDFSTKPVQTSDVSAGNCKEQRMQNKLTGTNRNNCFNSSVLTRRLPEIKPKIASEGYKVDEIAWHCSNGSRAAPRTNPWGPHSYSELISGAIRASPGNKASLQQIYDWIVANVPWFHDKGDYPSTKGWKNAIRHTLSIRKRFTRIVNDRSPHASLWTFSRNGYRTMAKF